MNIVSVYDASPHDVNKTDDKSKYSTLVVFHYRLIVLSKIMLKIYFAFWPASSQKLKINHLKCY